MNEKLFLFTFLKIKEIVINCVVRCRGEGAGQAAEGNERESGLEHGQPHRAQEDCGQCHQQFEWDGGRRERVAEKSFR